METKTRILIADTNEEFRNLLSELIRDEGDMEVVGAVGDGIEALSKASEEKPDVLICDLVLSKLDGLEVLHRLPEASPGTKPIVVSGFINDKIVSDCAAAGVAYFMPKPCDVSTLLSRVRQAAAGAGVQAAGRENPALYRSEPSLEALVTDIIH